MSFAAADLWRKCFKGEYCANITRATTQGRPYGTIQREEKRKNMRLFLNRAGAQIDISQLADEVQMSGEYTQACRTLSFGMLRSSTDWSIPYVEANLGEEIELYYGGDFIMSGLVWTRENDAEGKTLQTTVRDRGIYLKKNKTTFAARGETPESITARICAAFGIETGDIAKTGIGITRFFYGADLYSIIMTAYTKAAEQNGKKYMIRFRGRKLCVIEKGAADSGVYLRGDRDIIAATYRESLEDTVTRVAIYGQDNNLVKTVDNSELIKLYGVMQEYLKQSEDNSQETAAKKTLEKNGVERRVTVQNLGDARLVTGSTVYIWEPVTGLYGRFFIDGDTHTWKNGMYFNKLTLSFINMMDEKEAGSEKEQEYKKKEESKDSESSSKSTNGDGKSTGRFIWPTTVRTITSPFGNRKHPITGKYKLHAGIDIGAGSGSAIYAADGGTVSLSGVNGGYGKCIIIDHGGGLQTLYGHCSVLLVSSGAKVSKGQTIAKVGATGNVTGPHLHFEVRKNGSAVNPNGYL